jgi:3-oxoacyl-[acyl-carrier protein] reductase
VTHKVVLISGAAGGLGRGLVEAFLGQGWTVAAGYHRQPLAAPEAQGFLPVPLDVTNRASVVAGVKAVLSRFQRLDALVNNAAVIEDGLLPQMAEVDWDHVLAVNLKGAFLCSQAAIRPMLKQRAGHILNISSFVALTGRAGQANYAASKAGLIGLTESLAKEVGSRNVRVNAILPGVLDTSITIKLSSAQFAAIAGENVLGRINTVEEVARFIVFLAGTKSISGQVFQLDSRIARWC